jgi:hypothetical protein
VISVMILSVFSMSGISLLEWKITTV